MYEKFIEKVERIFNDDEAKFIFKAFEFAKKAHSNQTRYTGEPYIIHPIAVAEILLDFKLDHLAIAAALLHDVLEDTNVTENQLIKEFGEEVTELVNGVSRVKTLKYKNYSTENSESLRKMFLAMSKDIRVVLIKLADRLHNMRTLDSVSPEKQIRKAKDTFDIYVPLAERLGMSQFKCEMEDLCFKYLWPNEYVDVEKRLKISFEKHLGTLENLSKSLKNLLVQLDIKGEVFSRFKHRYSIYKKLQNKGIEKIYDILALRVLVPDVKDCYTVLGEVHNNWKPIPGRIKDYIAAPKTNMYQSLHTTCLTPEGISFEIQIRTYEMHKTCEYGIAAHWKYKEGEFSSDKRTELDKKLDFLRRVMEDNQEIADSETFVNVALSDLYTNTIFVFTPNFKVIQMPEKSTPIDFAYAIHSELGNKCVGSKVNGKMVPISTKLKTGDVVEIITSSSAKGPSRDWIKFAQTNGARNRIRNFFKKEMKDENIKIGRDMLETEAKRRGYTFSALISDSKLTKYILERYSFSALDDLYASVGYGGSTSTQVIARFINEIEIATKKEHKLKVQNEKVDRKSGIIVDGEDDLYVRLGRCCNPIPGDDIIGFISRGRGITVHRSDCPNVKNAEKDRLIEVGWSSIRDSKYTISITIRAKDSQGLISKISALISNLNISFVGMNANVSKGEALINMKLQISDKKQISELINKLSAFDDIKSVFRG